MVIACKQQGFPYINSVGPSLSLSASLGLSVVLGNLIQYSGLNPLVVVFISLHVVLEHKWFSLVGKIYLHTSSVGHI